MMARNRDKHIEEETLTLTKYKATITYPTTVLAHARPKLLSKGNLFAALAIFFKPQGRLENLQQSNIITSILQDLIMRKNYKLERLLEDLEEYCEDECGGEAQGQAFLSAFLSLCGSGESNAKVEQRKIQRLLQLVWKYSGSFQDIFNLIDIPKVNHGLSLSCDTNCCEVLRYFLMHSASLKVASGKIVMRFVDAPLVYGETPLMFSSRHRRPDLVHLLLQYGAKVESRWLNFESAIETLLFAPNLILLSPEDEESIRECLEYYLRTLTRVNIPRLLFLQEDGYTALHSNWRALIPTAYFEDPASLKHLCRVHIRNILNMNEKLPEGIDACPLPSSVKTHLNIEMS